MTEPAEKCRSRLCPDGDGLVQCDRIAGHPDEHTSVWYWASSDTSDGGHWRYQWIDSQRGPETRD